MPHRVRYVDAIIFDLDGTLISYPTTPLAADENRRIQELTVLLKDRLGKKSISAYWRIRSKLKNLKDSGVLRLVRKRTPDFLEALGYYETSRLGINVKRYRDAFRRIVLNAYLRRVYLYPDVIPCLTTLRSHGFRLGLLSNGPSFVCDEALDRFELRRFFDSISSTWTLRSFKPDSQIFLDMTRQLGVGAEQTLVVGDSLDCDVQGARNIGALSAYLIREHNLPRNQDELSPPPDIILRDLNELPPIVRRITLKVRVMSALRRILNISSAG